MAGCLAVGAPQGLEGFRAEPRVRNRGPPGLARGAAFGLTGVSPVPPLQMPATSSLLFLTTRVRAAALILGTRIFFTVSRPW